MGRRAQATRRGARGVLAAATAADLGGVADLIRSLPQLPEAELIVVGGPQRSRLGSDPAVSGCAASPASCGWGSGCTSSVRSRRAGCPTSTDPPLWWPAPAARGPFSVMPLEAMACGCPVVGYRGSAADELIADGRTGALVIPGDLFGLTRALSEVLADRLSRVCQGSAARFRAQQSYSWASIAALVEQVYAEAIAQACTGSTMRVSLANEAGVCG